MREILFRGKRQDDGEWIEGNYCCAELLDKSGYEHIIVEKPADGKSYVVIPETVCEYTGLTDKNGKRIFENGYFLIENEKYKISFDNAEYILINIFNYDIIPLKNNSKMGVFIDEI